MDFVPQGFAVRRIDHFCLNACTYKDGADGSDFVGYYHFHAAKVAISFEKAK
jgi:hypothetical protein